MSHTVHRSSGVSIDLTSQGSAPARPLTKKGLRLEAIDGVRGLIMFFMALDHACWYLAADSHPDEFWGGKFPIYHSAVGFLTRFVSHFCAPGFFFLMGLSMVLLTKSRKKSGWSENQIIQFFLTRGLVFIGIQFLIENPLWAISFKTNYQEMALYVGVLAGLGSSMILGAYFLKLKAPTLLIISGIGLSATWYLVPESTLFGETYPVLQRLLYIPGQTKMVSVYFSLFPWFFVSLIGMAFGKWVEQDAQKAFKRMGIAGLLCLGAFAIVRFGTSSGNLRPLSFTDGIDWKIYMTLTKYPASFLFLSFLLGVDMIILFLWNRWDLGNLGLRVFEDLGKAPFFFYIGHLVVYAFFGIFLTQKGLDLGLVYPLWLLGALLLIPATRWFSRFKQTQSATSYWRLF